MENKKLAIFDLDGTLMDAYKAIQETVNYCLKKLGYPPVSLEKIKRAVGRGDIDLASKLVSQKDTEALISLYRENHIKFLDGNIRKMDGAEELLRYLKDEGLYIAVATNRAGFSVGPILERLNIDRYFDIIYTRDDVEKPKPDPEMILKAMGFFRVKREKVFFVGDMDIDYFTGKNAGVDTYIVTTGSSPKEELERYNDIKMFADLISLKEYLGRRI